MNFLNRSAFQLISISLISFLIFYVSGLFIAIVFWLPNKAEAVSSDIFSDGFESEDFSSWTSSGDKWNVTSGGPTDTHDGLARADVKGNTGDSDDVLLNNISTAGHENIVLSFWYKVKDSLEEGDHVYVEWTTNSLDWNQLADFTDIDETIDENEEEIWVNTTYDLPEDVDNNENLGLRFRAQLNAGNDKFYLDDVSLSGEVISEESPTPTPEPEGGKLSGYKFEDLDGDGEKDNDEPLLNDWIIWLNGDSYAVTGDDDKGWPDGYYEFDDLESDGYVVCEEKQPSEEENNWTQTYPSNNIDESDEHYDYIYESCNDDFEISDSLARYGYEVEIGEDTVEDLNFGNIDGSIVRAFKFKDLNTNGNQNESEPALEGWNMCLYRWSSWDGEESGDFDGGDGDWELVEECKDTGNDGWAIWTNLNWGSYRLEEEDRIGWTHTTDNSYEFELDEENAVYKRKFGNWTEDQNPPVSKFDQSREYEVIDTEMVSLELIGNSRDLEYGVRSAIMSVYQLGGSESVQSYPAQSFFDVFVELKCPTERPAEPSPTPTPSFSPIPIEIVALDLVSVDPITVNWSHNWKPSSTGTYCFEVKSTDYAGNVEHTAWAGPLAYVPVVQIEDEEVANATETNFTVKWTTNKPATSRVIYDTVSHSDLGEAPNYSYVFSTVEQDLDPKVTNHSVIVSGLSVGTTYYYRTVSAASPESVGEEGSTSTQSQASNNNGGGGGGAPGNIIIDGPDLISTSTSTLTSSTGSINSQQAAPRLLGEARSERAAGQVIQIPVPFATPGPLLVAGVTTSSSRGSVGESSVKVSGFNNRTVGESDKNFSPSPSVNPEVLKDKKVSDNSLFASLFGLFGSINLWWLLVLVGVIISVAYMNKNKNS